MKQAITPAYTFTPSTNTINLYGIPSGIPGDTTAFNVSQLYAIIDVTANQILYAVGTSYGLVSTTGTSVVVQYNCSALNSTDTLMILYEADVALESDGTILPGTPGATSTLVGGYFNSFPIQMSNGQQASLQLDTRGNLKTAINPGSLVPLLDLLKQMLIELKINNFIEAYGNGVREDLDAMRREFETSYPEDSITSGN